MQTLATTMTVLSTHCDDTGCMHGWRYFELINALVEDWFVEVVGLSFAEMHRGAAGVPTTRLAVDIPAPSRLGDRLDLGLSLTRLGDGSLGLRMQAHCAGEPRLAADAVLVWVRNDHGRLARVPIPDRYRTRVKAWSEGGNAVSATGN